VPVTAAPVVRGDLLVRVLCDGRLEPPDGGELRVADGGTVAALAVHEGDRVRRGQQLLRLVNPDLEARARDARAELRRLQTESATTADDLDREAREAAWREQVAASDRRLLAKGAIPRSTLEADELAWHQALDRLHDAEARLDALRRSAGQAGGGGSRLALALGAAAELDRRVRALTVHAPFDGMVYGLPRAVGETVPAGQLVASVTDPDRPHVRCRVDQPDLPRVAPNQRLIVTFNGLPDRKWDGTVQRVGTGLREAGGREVGEIVGELSDPVHTLPANAAVDVQVVVAQKRGVLSIPRSALRRETDQGGADAAADENRPAALTAGDAGPVVGGGTRRYVYTVSRRHAHRRDVTVGLIGLAEVEVLAGLREGERVVAEGPPTLEENVRVIEAKPTH
jgi:multidrug efflux pump subunit AcrA (membrane-fusion protein)